MAPEFNGLDLTDGTNLVGHIDKARAQRYSKLGDALEFYQGRLKLPNLDKVLPLPPAPLPKWDGNVQSLIDGAKAVTPPPAPKQGAALQGHEFIPHGYRVSSLSDSMDHSDDQRQNVKPMTGFLLPFTDRPAKNVLHASMDVPASTNISSTT
ncbi:DUF6396 domain-containing protein [Burkholderia guangdongensis]|uniref:DUF6396 domain-containing protein n=1 Tax=Burkholderia guangdongensis TaxID=1792500 RepID=UPI003CCD3B74